MGGSRTYKPRHLRQPTKSFQPRAINLERDRDQKLHKTAEWTHFRSKFLNENPECYCCGEVSKVVDHIEPSKGRLDVFERTGNHIALCTRHHNTITGKFDARFCVGGDLAPKLNWIAHERVRNEVMSDRKFKPVRVVRYKK